MDGRPTAGKWLRSTRLVVLFCVLVLVAGSCSDGNGGSAASTAASPVAGSGATLTLPDVAESSSTVPPTTAAEQTGAGEVVVFCYVDSLLRIAQDETTCSPEYPSITVSDDGEVLELTLRSEYLPDPLTQVFARLAAEQHQLAEAVAELIRRLMDAKEELIRKAQEMMEAKAAAENALAGAGSGNAVDQSGYLVEFLFLDADVDGLPDLLEDSDGNGTLDLFEDADGDGLLDVLGDADGDRVPNYLDDCPASLDRTWMEVLFLVFRERARELLEDQRYWLARLEERNRICEAVSDALAELARVSRDLNRQSDVAWEYRDTNLNGFLDLLEGQDGSINLLLDADGNGVLDIVQDADGDGVPDPIEDDDGDTVAKVVDLCPAEPGPPHNDGCPIPTAGATTTTSTTSSTTTTDTTTTTTTTATTTTTTTTVAPPSGGTLDAWAAATYGDHKLITGFLTDPAPFEVTAGGTIDLSRTGLGCTGYAAQSPDLRLDWVGDGLLRFYFVPDDPAIDTVLVVNDSSGRWHCADDSHGTLHPTLDLDPSQNGLHEIWVATYTGGLAPGTLYITELSDNHP